MKRIIALTLFAMLAGCGKKEQAGDGYTGSKSCRECHAKFYSLWEPSHHGKAMQPYSDEFATENLTPQTNDIVIDDIRYRADISTGNGLVLETKPDSTRKYPIEHVMGGKNVYFFLTPMKRGRLQVLPIAYNVNTKQWYDTMASMVRHFADNTFDQALHWTDPLLTFNTACFNCHVSQLQKNYDLATDTYKTVWGEPGINCEACHGPGGEHVRVCRKAGDKPPKDLELIIWNDLSVNQKNDACSVCHAKASALTPAFDPGQELFDHYDLVCLEDRDFYPDGRDLGENYTLTSWMMSPCLKSGKLDCIHCHTSSGRYRFKNEKHNNACLPCHKERVADIKGHSHHAMNKDNSPTCVSCHMPMTAFGRMNRSDHSMRPPTPEATQAFKSPNACNICHKDKDVAWAADKISKWHPERKWSKRVLREGHLVQWARDRKWEHLPEVLEYIRDPKSDDVMVTSLIRLLYTCRDMKKMPALGYSLKHRSPLVRASAVTAMGVYDEYAVQAILPLLDDKYRLVRVRAADALVDYPRERLTPAARKRFEKVEKEFMVTLTCRPDQWSSHYNLANYWSRRGQLEKAMPSFEMAIRQRPDVILPYVNASITVSQLGDSDRAYGYLQKAYKVEPENGAVNFNLGLLLAERKDMERAERHLRKAMKDNDIAAQAAYNLAVIVGARDPSEAVKLCRKALESEPGNQKYQQALDYYQSAEGKN